MSISKYNASTGELTNLASGSRVWVGSESAYRAEKSAGTLPNNAIICITDDEVDTCHYSTDETFTGMYWIDKKKIYRRVFEISSPVPTSTTNLTSSQDCESLVSQGGEIIIDTNTIFPFPRTYSNFECQLRVAADHNIAFYRSDTSINYSKIICWVEYTKTTDN